MLVFACISHRSSTRLDYLSMLPIHRSAWYGFLARCPNLGLFQTRSCIRSLDCRRRFARERFGIGCIFPLGMFPAHRRILKCLYNPCMQSQVRRSPGFRRRSYLGRLCSLERQLPGILLSCTTRSLELGSHGTNCQIG